MTELTNHIAYMKDKYMPLFENDYGWHHYELKQFFNDVIKGLELADLVKQDKAL